MPFRSSCSIFGIFYLVVAPYTCVSIDSTIRIHAEKNTLSPLKGDHCKRKCLYSKFQSSIFRGYRYVRGVVISNLWCKHLLFSNWTSLLTDRTPRKRLDFAGGSPSLNRLHFWLCLPRQSPSPAREWLHQWTAERWMTNQFASAYEFEWRFHSILYIYLWWQPTFQKKFLMSICSDCAGSNVSIHSMGLASDLPCTACHFVATHTDTFITSSETMLSFLAQEWDCF